MPLEPKSVLELKDVNVRLSGTSIIEDLSLCLEAGELALLLGHNGAGKSTLLRAIAHLLPYAGDILIAGHRPASTGARSSFVFVPDEAVLYEDLTLAEHIHFTSRVYRQPDAAARMFDWLAQFHLTDFQDEFPSTHSSGMRRKLMLALALGLETPLLMLDEPYNGLDAEAQEVLSQALVDRGKRGGTVLLSAHQTELKTALKASLLTLERGRLTDTQVNVSS